MDKGLKAYLPFLNEDFSNFFTLKTNISILTPEHSEAMIRKRSRNGMEALFERLVCGSALETSLVTPDYDQDSRRIYATSKVRSLSA